MQYRLYCGHTMRPLWHMMPPTCSQPTACGCVLLQAAAKTQDTLEAREAHHMDDAQLANVASKVCNLQLAAAKHPCSAELLPGDISLQQAGTLCLLLTTAVMSSGYKKLCRTCTLSIPSCPLDCWPCNAIWLGQLITTRIFVFCCCTGC